VNEFLLLPEERRRIVCEEAQGRLGLPPATIEKDFWVCWTLKKLFNLPKWGQHLTFKGGTLLSKGWGLIKRFSEDVDIVINRHALGFGGDMAPDHAPSKKQTRKRLDAMKEASQKCVNKVLLPLLAEVVDQEVPAELTWHLEPDPDDPDEQTLLLTYPTVFSDQMAYLRQVVKIELGARSDTEPTQDVNMHPYLKDAFPNVFPQSHFSVRAISLERAFWEKAMLLHEETFRPPEKKRQARLARHYYDLYCLIDAGVGQKAAGDLDLFKRIAAHRQVYFRYTWVDYGTLRPGFLRLVPSEEQITTWKSDYSAMKDEMFFEKPPEFEDIIQAIKHFQEEFNRKVA
jgi:predicted nucleotidyltransferase component of viral defense system